MIYTFSDLFFTRSATFLGTPRGYHHDRLLVRVRLSVGMKPSRAILRRLLIRVRLSMGMKPSRATLRRLPLRTVHPLCRMTTTFCASLLLTVANLLG
jgi:hypothetical protein